MVAPGGSDSTVLVARASDPQPVREAADVVVADDGEQAAVEGAIATNPQAATALALVLRDVGDRSIADGLLVESATYSTLQAGPEAQRWLAARRRTSGVPAPASVRSEGREVVRVARTGDGLRLTLDRPEVHNAFSAAVREGLLDGLAVAAAVPELQVVIDGAGPSFCSGGDLTEFGTASDPATAHLVRVTRSVGRALASMADRVEVRLHGACVGAGVELPAFAGRVVATPDTRFRLPEVSMGLVPGAGGTISIPKRIGRQRTMWLALTGAWVDATTALAWGLVDELAEEPIEG